MIVLLGYRGSGKSTVGRRLADQLWSTFADTDEHLVSRAGRTIREIFAADGEAAFRQLESDALQELLGRDIGVLATGGGIVLSRANRALLQANASTRIYLKCDPTELLRRIDADTTSAQTRPNLTSAGGLAEIEQLLTARELLYREVSTHELDVTHLSPQECVVRVTPWC